MPPHVRPRPCSSQFAGNDGAELQSPTAEHRDRQARILPLTYHATGSRSGSRDEQKPDSFFAGLDRYLVATIEENERAIAGAFADQGFSAIDLLFGQDIERPPQFAFGSRAKVIGTCGVREFFPKKQTTCCAAYGRSDKGH
jgi:hypothetical protein